MKQTIVVLSIEHEAELPEMLFRLAKDYPEVFLGIEIWRPHPEFPQYEFSSNGRIRRLPGKTTRKNGTVQSVRGGEISPGKMPRGYRNWGVSVGGRKGTRSVHRAVLNTFIGPAPGLVACHLNGMPSDNSLLNLMWGTQKENCSHMVRHGTRPCGEGHPGAKLTNAQVVAIRSDQRSSKVIAAEYGVYRNYVDGIKAGRRRKNDAGVKVDVTATLVKVPDAFKDNRHEAKAA